MQPYNDVDKLVHHAIKSILNELFAHHYDYSSALEKRSVMWGKHPCRVEQKKKKI
jgi:hypothetical protein